MNRAWSLITVGEDRQYGGNTGYDDEPHHVYRYDSNVANSKQMSEGDFVVLRNKRSVLGAARITRIDTGPGKKTVRRCPQCGTTGIKLRNHREPQWLCNKGHEFSTPTEIEVEVTKYSAFFGETFTDLQEALSLSQLKQAALRPSDQLSIEEVDLSQLEELLTSQPNALDLISRTLVSDVLGADEADQNREDTFLPTMVDQRQAVLRAIKVRRGQATFRKELIKRYGPACMVTGCTILDLLEAAHIVPYRGAEFNDSQNGLLLRADIHTLFDLNLVWIEPETLRVRLDSSLLDSEYAAFDGKSLVVGSRKPSENCLLARRGPVDRAQRWVAIGD